MSRRAAWAGSCAAVALIVSGCAPMIPTDGPVGTSDPDTQDGGSYLLDAQPPVPGSEPSQLIDDFLQAGVGPQDDYAVAREYLTPSEAREWSPGERTVVYSSTPEILQEAEDTYSVQFPVEAVIDADGIMTMVPPNTSEAVDFTVEEFEGEWRISDAPEGTFLAQPEFTQVYQSHTLYFYNSDQTYAVPDERWFVNMPGRMPAAIVEALLDGPAPYLEPAVTSAFPQGTELQLSSVPVEGRTAVVDFAAGPLSSASPEDQQLMEHQLSLALTGLNSVSEVEITVDQRELEAPDEEDEPEELEILAGEEISVRDTQIGLVGDELVRAQGNNMLSIGDLPDLSDIEPQQPAVANADPDTFAVLGGDGDELYHIRPGRSPDQVLEGEDLTRPSMDNDGWTWTAANPEGGATIHASAYDESLDTMSAEISADWLEGRSITSLRIAQDGARAAMVVDDGGDRALYVAGVIRDSAGTPQGLGQPTRMQTLSEIDEVRWGDDALVVWATHDEDDEEAAAMQIELVRFTGTREELHGPVLGLENVSAGEGQRQVWAEAQGAQQLPIGEGWRIQGLEALDLAYPG